MSTSALPTLRQRPRAVGTAGPQLSASDRGHRWTSTWDRQSSVGTAGPQRPDRMPEDMPDKVPECLPDRTPEDLPDRMPDRMSEEMPEDIPDRVPEDMPDRMQREWLLSMSSSPWYVMVGITWSKVIYSKQMLFFVTVEVSSAKATWKIICESCHQDSGLGLGWPKLRTLDLLRKLFYCFLKTCWVVKFIQSTEKGMVSISSVVAI